MSAGAAWLHTHIARGASAAGWAGAPWAGATAVASPKTDTAVTDAANLARRSRISPTRFVRRVPHCARALTQASERVAAVRRPQSVEGADLAIQMAMTCRAKPCLSPHCDLARSH
ncbi:hypothetical protein GCM10010201_25490 [Pilimelia columellifera subsp. columellifera]|uniref:Uncharacterized protein n=1 Tax=Pilimelia columellifera subsp. columellifera TaxID=706583 RepID=A0ABN3NL28_9ACTN